MVVWERESGTPVKTFFNPHPYGVHALDIAPKLQYLVTLAAPTPSSDPNASQPEMSREGKSIQKDGEHGETADYQSISVWDWPSDHDGPICTAAVGTNDVQTCVLFNAWDTHEIATNGKRRVFFWTWDVEQPFQFLLSSLSSQGLQSSASGTTRRPSFCRIPCKLPLEPSMEMLWSGTSHSSLMAWAGRMSVELWLDRCSFRGLIIFPKTKHWKRVESGWGISCDFAILRFVSLFICEKWWSQLSFTLGPPQVKIIKLCPDISLNVLQVSWESQSGHRNCRWSRALLWLPVPCSGRGRENP